MKRSDAAAISVGTLTALIVGITGSMLFPVAGLMAGAYFSATAATGAGMGLFAVWALGAAGAIGGLALGKLAKPLAVWTGVAAGIVAGGVTKASGVIVGFLSRAFGKNKPAASSVPPEKNVNVFSGLKGLFKSKKIKPGFDASSGRAARNKPPPSAPDAPQPPL
ncbi:MAG: hypothetical protein K8R48_03190 [Alphaproteobacteria bacterium]|nr:hypothetical protein [Alphaproteobacteria bacterium]